MKILLFILLWYIVGLIVLVSVDKDEAILDWFRYCPRKISWWAKPMAFTCWPVLVWMYYRGD